MQKTEGKLMGYDEEEHLNLCCRCMEMMPEGENVCPHCGFDNRERLNTGDILPERTILAGKYLIGRMLGRGGFGVTYLGYDLILRVKVAVKEYYPLGISTRDTQSNRICCIEQDQIKQQFLKGRNAFQDEAQHLALFDSPFIVRVRDFFLENGTSYIIMEYTEGDDLPDRIARTGGRLPVELVLELFRPLIRELGNLHAHKLIHRDIKPANIKIAPDRRDGTEHLVLLDFGAARGFISENVTQAYTTMVTQGYAPIEQYSPKSRQGPYTDVYGLCATMYNVLTGEKPPSSTDMLVGAASLKPFSDFGIVLPEPVEKAILHGLELKSEDRTRNMQDFYRELYENTPVPSAEAESTEETRELKHTEDPEPAQITGGTEGALSGNASSEVNEDIRKEEIYQSANEGMTGSSPESLEEALKLLKSITGYKKADELAAECEEKISLLRKNEVNQAAPGSLKPDTPSDAGTTLTEQIPSREDADKYTAESRKKTGSGTDKTQKKNKKSILPILPALLAAAAIFFMLRSKTEIPGWIIPFPATEPAESSVTGSSTVTPLPEPTETKHSLLVL